MKLLVSIWLKSVCLLDEIHVIFSTNTVSHDIDADFWYAYHCIYSCTARCDMEGMDCTVLVTQDYLGELDERASASVRISSQYIHFDADKSLSDESRSLFAEVMLRNPLFHSVYIGFDNGDYVGIVNLDADKKTRSALQAEPADRWVLVNIKGKGNKRQRTMTFVDGQFKIRAEISEKADDFLSNSRPWFINATKDKVYKTAPYLFQQLQVPGETYSIRLASHQAVLGLDITLASISDYLTSQKTPFDSEMYLFDEMGGMVASNQADKESMPLPSAPDMPLTDEQARLVDQTPYLFVSNEMDWPPVSFSASGKPHGYTVDLLNYISQMTGIEIRYVNGMPWHQLGKLFIDDQIDILQPVFYDPVRELLGKMSAPILKVPYGVLTAKGNKPITHIEQLDGKTVAIPKDWLLAENLAEDFPEIKVIEVANVRAMFDAVRDGKADAAMDTSAILDYTARQFFIDDVTITAPLEFGEVHMPETLHFMLAKNKAELTSLFNQALAKLGPEYQQALEKKWFSADGEQFYHIGMMPYKSLIKVAQKGGTGGLDIIDLQGDDYYVYVTPFGKHNNKEDFFAIVTPVDKVLVTSTNKVIKSIIITIVALLFFIPLAWLLAAPFVKPIGQLAANSKNIAHRRYSKVSEVDSRVAEVHDLAISMSDMSASIQQHEQAQQDLLDAFIKVIAQAIDDKSHHTAGHCERVPQLALMLIEHAHESDSDVFKSFSFESSEQRREFEVAAWLHDCGKITTPEHIIDKGTKLEANYNRIHEVRMRFEVLLRDTEIDYLIKLAEPNVDKAALLLEKQQKQEQLHDDFAFIANANIGGEFMSDEHIERLQTLANTTWQRHFDDRLGLSHIELARYPQDQEPLPAREQLLADKQHHRIERSHELVLDPKFNIKMDVPKYLYDMGELYNLSVKRGTLANEDRFKINEHMISTIKMLENLPFPEEMSNVPRYASTHHETMKGTGYPRKLSAEELSVPERVMVVADIFEALTAADRPYKKAKSISQAIDILHKMALDEHVDIEVFELFLTTGTHLEYAKRFLPATQLDDIDITKYLRTS